MKMNKKIRLISFPVIICLLLGLFLYAVNVGSLKVTFGQIIRGLFVEYDPTVASIYDLRFPRIFTALLAGAATAVSGVLFQAVLKNPLADPGIIGVSSGAGFMTVFISVCLPALTFFIPIAAVVGAMGAFFLVYTLSWKEGLSPIRIVLVGVAVEACFSGLTSALNSMTGGQISGAASIVNGNITLKTWSDVRVLALFSIVGLIAAMIQIGSCNLMALEDKTVTSLGININMRRILCSLTGALLAGISAGIVGKISFLGLIAPHMARIFVGHDHKALLPFSMLLGAFLLLAADTAGRVIAYPYEVSAGILMAVVGGPFFIFLLKRSKKSYAS